jgi:dihydroorotate dehydrogenase (NAD+) catalytic subunit
MSMAETTTELCGVSLSTPIVLAAGTCGYVDEMNVALDLSRIGAVTTKSITPEPREGNPPMRVLDTRDGMLNSVGLANMGLARFIEQKAPIAASVPTTVIGSIAGFSIEDYVTVASALEGIESIPIVEMNVSCPNTDDGFCATADPARLREHVAAVRQVLVDTRLFVKLPPSTEGLAETASVAIEAGADGLTLVNTLEVMSIDVETRRSRFARHRKGMSGPAIHPLTVRLVNEVYTAVARDAGVPIIGIGGVLDWRDAAEFILAGATAVGLGTALFVDPRSPLRIADGLERWSRKQGCASISELIGGVVGPA